jgi:hypothetical protein
MEKYHKNVMEKTRGGRSNIHSNSHSKTHSKSIVILIHPLFIPITEEQEKLYNDLKDIFERVKQISSG